MRFPVSPPVSPWDCCDADGSGAAARGWIPALLSRAWKCPDPALLGAGTEGAEGGPRGGMLGMLLGMVGIIIPGPAGTSMGPWGPGTTIIPGGTCERGKRREGREKRGAREERGKRRKRRKGREVNGAKGGRKIGQRVSCPAKKVLTRPTHLITKM